MTMNHNYQMPRRGSRAEHEEHEQKTRDSSSTDRFGLIYRTIDVELCRRPVLMSDH